MNNDFELYVKKYSEKHNITPEEAKTHKMVRDVEAYYKELNSGGDSSKGD